MERRYDLVGIVAGLVGISPVSVVVAVISAISAAACAIVSLVQLGIKVVDAVHRWRSGKISAEEASEELAAAANEFKEDLDNEV